MTRPGVRWCFHIITGLNIYNNNAQIPAEEPSHLKWAKEKLASVKRLDAFEIVTKIGSDGLIGQSKFK